MNVGDPLLFAHAFATTSLVGLIWTIQLVHYPLFMRIPGAAFHAYESEHMRRITWLVGPLMLLEATTVFLLILSRPELPAVWVGGGLLVIIWVSTAAVQGPLHGRLARDGFDEKRIRLLVGSNWLRTFAWTLRGILSLSLLGAGYEGVV